MISFYEPFCLLYFCSENTNGVRKTSPCHIHNYSNVSTFDIEQTCPFYFICFKPLFYLYIDSWVIVH